MQVVYHEAQRRHDPRHFLVNGAPQANPEVPGRIDALLASAKEGGHQVVAPRDHGLAPLAAVHSPEYLAFLETIYTRWQRIDGASAEVVPNIHPDGPGAGYPRSAVGQAGYHMADTACPMTADTWGSTLASAWSAVEGAELILAGARAAYALCRPPGHHAFKDRAGGFCYVNNCAVAATVLRREAARVAILDVDLHHGNGTQGAGERGEGPGLGYNLNLPLARGSDDAAYAPALEAALARIRSFAPDTLVVALGLDAHESDPFGGLRISTDGFGRIAEAVAGLGLPTLLVQEGGYLSEHLGPNLARFLGSFEAAQGAGT
jgi:acetoin utilization deacetylase AcuC-like enzyme